jgi:hypothetical protein
VVREIIIPNTYELRSYGIMWVKLVEFNNGQCVNLEIEGKYGTLISIFVKSYQELFRDVEFILLNELTTPIELIRLLLSLLVKNRKLIENGIKELKKE